MAATTEQDVAPFEIGKVRSPIVSRGKSQQSLVKAGNLGVSVQCVSNDSGETNLHSHPGMDSAWMVLNGKAKFYTVNDRLLGELGKNEVISIPAGAPYWFEAADEDPLVILHITSRLPEVKGGNRIDYSPRDVGGDNRVRDLTGEYFE